MRKTYNIEKFEDLEIGMFFIDKQFGKIEILDIIDENNIKCLVDEFIVPQIATWELFRNEKIKKIKDYPEYAI